MKKRIIVVFAFIGIIIAYFVIVFKYNSDFLANGTNFFNVLMTFTAICGVFGIIYQNDQSNKLNAAQFIFDLNQQYISNINYQKVLDMLETNSDVSYSVEFNDTIAQCLDFFESLYIFLQNGLISMMLIDELFCFRFFIVVNSRYVQDNVLTPHKDYYRNIVRLHYVWKNYKLKRGSEKSIPMINSDLSLVGWYGEACPHHRRCIPISNSLTHIALVREALLEDANSINQLYHQLFKQDVIDIDAIEQINKINQDDNSYIFVATLNGKTIGTIQCTVCQSIPFDGDQYMLVENYIVDKQYRFKGVGVLLFGKVKGIAREYNIKSIVPILKRK